MAKTLFVTGTLAEPALRATLEAMAPPFPYEVAVLRITVAALMTTPWIARHLPGVADCERVWTRLPRHPRRQRVDEEALVAVPAPAGATDPVEDDERRVRGRELVAALEAAIAALPPGDQVILRLRYWSGVKVSRIAEVVGEDQKALYRRFERLWSRLRDEIAARGVSGAGLDELFGGWTPGGEEAERGE